MSVLSKCVADIDCRKFVHPFQPSCRKAAIYALRITFVNSLQIYRTLYLLSALLRGKPLKYYISKLPQEIVRSSVFLALNCFGFLGSFCIARKLCGNVNYWGTLLTNIPACFISILIERKQRRGMLALYLFNLAAETGFNMLVFRNLITSLPNGEVLLFAIASAVYSLLFKLKKLDSSTQNIIKNFVGPYEERSEPSEQNKISRKSRITIYYSFLMAIISKTINICNRLVTSSRRIPQNPRPNIVISLMQRFENKIEGFLSTLSQSKCCKHNLCKHRYNCVIYALLGFVQRFVVGFGIQTAVKILSSFSKIIKSPKILLKILKNPVNKELGMFLGVYVFIYRALCCLYRWLTNTDNGLSGLISGFFAGWSMMYYKSSSIALYFNFKLLEVLWMLGVSHKKLPLFKNFDIVLYTLSTAFVLWVSIFEPHNIRYAYWKFMCNISNNKLKEVDRYALDTFGTQASLIDRMGIA